MNSLRIRFTRGEGVKFISHLDLMKVFERAIRRSNLPISYSQGFNPHPQMVFGLPLAVGMTSECEYADFELTQEIPPEQFMERLNESLPEEIRITAAAPKRSKKNIMSTIVGADYVLEIFSDEEIPLHTAMRRVENLLKRESIKVLKEGRGKDRRATFREVEIRPLILNVELEPIESLHEGYEIFQSAFVIKAGFKAGSEANLRPELFIKALCEQADISVVASRIHRKALYISMGGSMMNPMDEAALI